MRLAQLLCLIATVALSCNGCALISNNPMAGSAEGLQADPRGTLKPNASAETFQKVKQAKRENAVVLQIQGEAEPVRVLPLPREGQSVYVSDLLTQTGVFRKFGRVDAELYRNSTNLMDGVRMKVNIRGGDTIAPETDYALRPGDRLLVRRAPATTFGDAFEGVLPDNAMRAIGFGR